MAEYHNGGMLPSAGPTPPIRIHPDECIIRASDAKSGRWVCSRVGHPTGTSDCAARRG